MEHGSGTVHPDGSAGRIQDGDRKTYEALVVQELNILENKSQGSFDFLVG